MFTNNTVTNRAHLLYILVAHIVVHVRWTLKPIEQMLLWLEECETASKDHDVPRLLKLLDVVNEALDTEYARSRTPKGSMFPQHISRK